MNHKDDENMNDTHHIQKINEMKNIQMTLNNDSLPQHSSNVNMPITSINPNDNETPNKLNMMTLVEKNTYDNTLPAWFTLPSNAVNATVSLSGGGGGGGGANAKIWGVSGAGGSAGETIWQVPLNVGDTIYSVIGQGGDGGNGDGGPFAHNGHQGNVTIVEGSSNFPLGGLRAYGGNGGQGARSDKKALGGAWVHTGHPNAIAGQSGGNGGFRTTPVTHPQDGWPCYTIPGGLAGIYAVDDYGAIYFGGGGGGANMISAGGKGGKAEYYYSGANGDNGTKGSGGGGSGAGFSNGGKGGNGWVRVQYYI